MAVNKADLYREFIVMVCLKGRLTKTKISIYDDYNSARIYATMMQNKQREKGLPTCFVNLVNPKDLPAVPEDKGFSARNGAMIEIAPGRLKTQLKYERDPKLDKPKKRFTWEWPK